MADVVEQPGHPHHLHHQVSRGSIGAALTETGVKVVGEAPTEVHCPDRVLKARVLGGVEDPPGGLELVDPALALEPGVVQERLLGAGPVVQLLGDAAVVVEGIGQQVYRLENALGIGHLDRHLRRGGERMRAAGGAAT